MLIFANTTNVVWNAFLQSDWFGRVIVIFLLFVSVFSWTMMVDKLRRLGSSQRANRRFMTKFSESGNILYMTAFNDISADSSLARVYDGAISELVNITGIDRDEMLRCAREKRFPRNLSTMEVEWVREAMEREIAGEIASLQKMTGMLGTVVSVSPFLGLLGTVWGVMLAFVALAEARKPDISRMAPGISGALLTTVVGLIVAIPAVIGYNLIVGRIKEVTCDMDNFCDQMVGLLRRQM